MGNIISDSKMGSNMPTHAYVVLLHLISQGYSTFIEMADLLCQDRRGQYKIKNLGIHCQGKKAP